jgi:hypothetical protein
VRLDNAGENRSFQELANTEDFNDVKFEFTAPRTPQQNGIVERAFPTLQGRVRAMMNYAGFTHSARCLMWVECANTSTLLDNGICDDGETPP